MTPGEFAAISELLKRRSGLILPPEKAYLLESRLRPVMRKHALADLSAVAAALIRQDTRLAADVVDAMTTNETLFFRDVRPFAVFREVVLPALLKARAAQRSFRILCAAASTGQEPYSLAMILAEEATRLKGWSCEIVGFDISPTALERARAGRFTQFEVQRGVPTAQLLKHFRRAGADWQIADELRAMVRFREFNLLDDHPVRPLRRGLLPQRADLLRPRDQGAHACQRGPQAAWRRLPVPRRLRNGDGALRRLRPDRRLQRRLPAGRGTGAVHTVGPAGSEVDEAACGRRRRGGGLTQPERYATGNVARTLPEAAVRREDARQPLTA